MYSDANLLLSVGKSGFEDDWHFFGFDLVNSYAFNVGFFRFNWCISGKRK
jgi:hypothetical protein